MSVTADGSIHLSVVSPSSKLTGKIGWDFTGGFQHGKVNHKSSGYLVVARILNTKLLGLKLAQCPYINYCYSLVNSNHIIDMKAIQKLHYIMSILWQVEFCRMALIFFVCFCFVLFLFF